MSSCGLVLLAAGSSTRMGQPKQLLVYHGMTLLESMLQNAGESNCEQVIVVLGADREKMVPMINKKKVAIVENTGWEEGMASSIRCGLAALLVRSPLIGAAVFMVCDQPFVSASLINDLINKKETTSKKIIACAYQNTVGTPAVFDKTLFPELMLLEGQEGAKKIIKQHSEVLETIPFPMGYIDIDTPGDFESLKNTPHSVIPPHSGMTE